MSKEFADDQLQVHVKQPQPCKENYWLKVYLIYFSVFKC